MRRPPRGALPLPLLSCLLLLLPHSSSPFSLKNCTILYAGAAVGDVNVSCVGRQLAAVPDDVPRNATSLDVSDNPIERIRRADLAGLRRLRDAQFNGNLIGEVAGGAFGDLAALKRLFITDNRLRRLTDGMFAGLAALEELSLNDNLIAAISPAALRPLRRLRLLQLGSNRLRRVEQLLPALRLRSLDALQLERNLLGAFVLDGRSVGASNLSSLDLSMNPVTAFVLAADVLPGLADLSLDECGVRRWEVADGRFLRSLSRLTLRGTSSSFQAYVRMLRSCRAVRWLQLDAVGAWAEQGLVEAACGNRRLSRLELTGNRLGTLRDALLRSCSQLTELELFLNQLSAADAAAFQTLRRLRVLVLSDNLLVRVPEALRPLSGLEVLDLSRNHIGQLDCRDFGRLSNLTSLNLNLNRVSSLQRCVFQALRRLEDLDLGRNPFFSVGGGFSAGPGRLRSLRLFDNQLSVLWPGGFANLSSLRRLDVESDAMYRVEGGAFEGLGRLLHLGVTLTFLQREQFAGLPSLESLDVRLSYAAHSSGPPPFRDLPSLRRLRLEVSGSRRVPVAADVLDGLRALQRLAAVAFFVTSLHADTFAHTPRLTSLQVTGSELSRLPPRLLRPVPRLQELDLSDNRLRSLDFLCGADLSELRLLRLSRNQLSVLNESVFRALPALAYLDLAANPFTCQCANAGAIRWILSGRRTQVADAHQYACAFPVSAQGTPFLDFEVRSCWMDASFVCFLSSAALVLSVLLSSFVHHFLRRQLAYACYRLLAFLYHRRRKEAAAAAAAPHRYDAFVSYNVRDEAWVCRELLPALEGRQGWRLCLHHRDFQPGRPIVENITDAIYSSRKTICVISRHYLQSEWCSREIQMASFRLFDERRDVLLPLFLEELPAHRLAAFHRMRSLLRRRSYLSWPRAAQDPALFWEKVRRALASPETAADHDLLGLA